tara:strand:+ start:201 stop:431 length:231 start_codon:yes stop_codon:yes gene_type:complete
MYSSSEMIAIMYLDMLNTLITDIKKKTDDITVSYTVGKIIDVGIKNIERVGGKVRIIEGGLLTLIEYNEKYCVSRL